MRIDRIDLRLLRLPLVRPFETSFGRSVDREFVLVEVRDGDLTGWGECVADAQPFYGPDTTRTSWHVLEEYLVPRLLGRDIAHPRDLRGEMGFVRGHRMAKAALEMACWDLWAREQAMPLSRALGGVQAAVASGVSVGIQPSVDALLERIAEELESGYQRVKIKIKPGWDVAIVDRVRARFPVLALMVDANAAYTLEDARHLQALDEFGLMMIEQPLDDEDLGQHAVLQRALATPICLDESIVSAARAEEAFALGACRIVNIKPGRVGGFAESVALHDACRARAVPVWHGGMLESGIGRAANLHLASLPNFTLPSDIAASRRYFVPDLIDPPIEVSAQGTIPVPTAPGLGVAIDLDRVAHATIQHASLPS